MTGWHICLVKTSHWLISDTSGSWWAATVAASCPGRMAEHPKSKSMGCLSRPNGSPCTMVKCVWGLDWPKSFFPFRSSRPWRERSQGPTLTHWTTYSKSSICPSQSHILGHLWNFNKLGLEDWSILLGQNTWSWLLYQRPWWENVWKERVPVID